MDFKKLVGNVANTVKDTSIKIGTEAKDGARLLKLKMDAVEIATKGIKDLKVYSERYPHGIVNEVVSEIVLDLENRRKAITKMSSESLTIDCEDLMTLVENHKESTSENEATKKLENSALSKVYKSATSVYQSLSNTLNKLINEYSNSQE